MKATLVVWLVATTGRIGFMVDAAMFGFPVRGRDDRTRASLAELYCLDRSIGATGRLALQPLLHVERQELWQLHLLEASG